MIELLLTIDALNIPITGPGRKIPLIGDFTDGYFGLVSSADFCTSNEFAALTGLNQGTMINNTSSWMKFAKAGRIYFIAAKPLRHSVTWNQCNTAGLIAGRFTTIKGYRFNTRLMTGGNGTPSTGAGGQWNDFMYSICIDRQAGFTPVYEDFSLADLGIGAGITGRYTICRDIVSAGDFPVLRGNTTITQYAWTGKTTVDTSYGIRPILMLDLV